MKASEAIDRAVRVIRRQHKALATEESYIFWLRRYIAALGRTVPEDLPSEKKLECFLTDLARHRDLSASSQNQAFNAILFFYRDVLGQPLGEVELSEEAITRMSLVIPNLPGNEGSDHMIKLTIDKSTGDEFLKSRTSFVLPSGLFRREEMQVNRRNTMLPLVAGV